MQTDPAPSPYGRARGARCRAVALSGEVHDGEELNCSDVTDRGLLGDRQFAVVDRSTGKVGGAKNPRKWGTFFDFRAAYVEPPAAGAKMSPVRITLPDGTAVTSGQGDLERVLSRAFGRDVAFEEARPGEGPSGARPRSTGRILTAWSTGTR